MRNNKRNILTLLTLLLVAVLMAGCWTAAPQDWQFGTAVFGDTNFTNLVASGDVTSGDDMICGDTLDLGGDLDLDGDGFDVDVTGAVSIDADVASNFSVAGAGIDLTLASAAGRVVIQASEAAANAVYIDADAAAGVGLDIDVGSTGGMSVDGGCLNVGGGTPASCGDNDAYVTGDFEVDADVNIDGTFDFDGTTFDVLGSGAISLDSSAAAGNFSVAGAGIDLTLASAAGRVVIQGSEAAADAVFIDADGDAAAGLDVNVGATNGMSVDGGCLNIGGGTPASCGDNDAYVTGDFEVDAALDVDGTIDHDGSTFDVDLSAGFSIDGDTASNISLSAQDLTVEAETGSVTVKGDEAAADAVYLDADEAAGTGATIAVGASGGLNITGGVTNVGGGSPGLAAGDNDLYVTVDFEVDGISQLDGAVNIDGAVDMDSTLDVAGAVALAADVTMANDATGGNLGAVNQYIGMPRWTLVDMEAGTNPASQSVSCIDETPTEWAAVGVSTTVTADTAYYRQRTNSVKIAFAGGTDNEGVDGTIAQVDLTDMETLGFWVYSDAAITAGDVDLTLDDTNGTDQAYSIGAVSAGVWTYVALDINACDANCDTTDGIHVLLTTQGAANALLDTNNIYLDEMWFWDDADQEALGQAIVDFGVIGVMTSVTTGAGLGTLVEGTDYFIHYVSGSDFIVWVTDQSANDNVAFIAY